MDNIAAIALTRKIIEAFRATSAESRLNRQGTRGMSVFFFKNDVYTFSSYASNRIISHHTYNNSLSTYYT